MWWKNWTMKPSLRTQGDARFALSRNQQEAIARTLALESEPIVKLLQENAYREVIWRQRVNEAAQAVTLAYSAGRDLDVVAGNNNTDA
jgi:phage-related baseplate assembly protein